jgi:hypothetical protein
LPSLFISTVEFAAPVSTPDAEVDTAAIAELEVIRTSIVNAIGRGRRTHNARQLARMVRYETLRVTLLVIDAATWTAYCAKHALPADHTALTLFS